MKISVYGAGFVGLTTAACLANIGHKVICLDIDSKKIDLLKNNKIPFYEPGLLELIELNQQKERLFFSGNLQDGLASEVIFNCVGTPSKLDGSADLTAVFQVVDFLAKNKIFFDNRESCVFINKSTVPPGTAAECQKKFSGTVVEVVANPEFLKEGSAVQDFTHPDKIVIGGNSREAKNIVKEIYAGMERSYLKIIDTDWETAEIIKYANNAFLATKISFINEIANICSVLGGDIKEVSRAIGMDYRIGPKFLHAGLGYGGFCLPKDVKALIHTAKSQGYNASLLKEVDLLNERQKKLIISQIKSEFSSFENKTFTIWGLTYKPQTSDIREAVSISMISELLSLGAKVKVYDPMAQGEAKKIFADKVIYCNSLSESVAESSGLIIATEWDEFRGIDLMEIGTAMKEKFLFDGRNIYEPKTAKEAGFRYFGVGRS